MGKQTRAAGAARLEAADAMERNVNHPTRYTKGAVECIEAIDSAVVGKPPDEAVCVGNIIKYIWRYEDKEPVRSLKSAEWFLKRLISKVESKTRNSGSSEQL